MMERQIVIDNIEALARDLENITGFITLISDFIEKPVSKKQVFDFCEKYILDVFMDACELKSLYALMTINPTVNNGSILRRTICYGQSIKSREILTNLRLRISNIFEDTFKLILKVEEDLKAKEFPDIIERLMALRRATCKIEMIFAINRQLPITVEQFPELDVEKHRDMYLNKDLSGCIEFVNLSNRNNIRGLSISDILESVQNRPLWLNSIMDKNNWISLRNFILYLDSFTKY